MAGKAHALYLVAANSKSSSILFGGKTADGKLTHAVPLRHKDAKALASAWPTAGHIVIYKLVAIENYWHDGPAVEKAP